MQLLMTFMIVYMFIGNQLSIYTIFAIVQSLVGSVGGLFKVNKSISLCYSSIRTIWRPIQKFIQVQADLCCHQSCLRRSCLVQAFQNGLDFLVALFIHWFDTQLPGSASDCSYLMYIINKFNSWGCSIHMIWMIGYKLLLTIFW